VLNDEGEEVDPPDMALGERLFLETRFAQFFSTNSGGNANATLAAGDLVMKSTRTIGATVAGPFAGQSMNCRACHLVDEQGATLGNNTYGDFARRSPIPDRGDGQRTTPRNSPPLVNASIARPGPLLLHFDGEFTNGRDLVKAAYTGRNFGWEPQEHDQAVAHIAHIIRKDDGKGELAREFGGAYRKVLLGTDPSLPVELRLPPQFRIDVSTATDTEILDAIAVLVDSYMQGLVFSQDEDGNFNGSPYDAFLRKNHLPVAPKKGERDVTYAKRLLGKIGKLTDPRFVTEADGHFHTHQKEFAFGPTELEGLRIFFTKGSNVPPGTKIPGQAGSCIACHAPPSFTDFGFHNNGAAQDEYDTLHGAGAFAKLAIPGLHDRQAKPDLFLPATPLHPDANSKFRSPPSAKKPGRTDLGLWNVFANPDFPKSQRRLETFLLPFKKSTGPDFTPADIARVLPRTIALFKTPGLRDLSHSAPYLHTGAKDSLEDVIEFYRSTSQAARRGLVRNPDPIIKRVNLVPKDTVPLAAFLRSLDEDYE
jgi:cytochrome c peroxidase